MLSAVQRLALVDAAAWWLTDPAGGQELTQALINGACADRVTAEHVYLKLIILLDQERPLTCDDRSWPSSGSDDRCPRGSPLYSVGRRCIWHGFGTADG